jgi:hypothetical protein
VRNQIWANSLRIMQFFFQFMYESSNSVYAQKNRKTCTVPEAICTRSSAAAGVRGHLVNRAELGAVPF